MQSARLDRGCDVGGDAEDEGRGGDGGGGRGEEGDGNSTWWTYRVIPFLVSYLQYRVLYVRALVAGLQKVEGFGDIYPVAISDPYHCLVVSSLDVMSGAQRNSAFRWTLHVKKRGWSRQRRRRRDVLYAKAKVPTSWCRLQATLCSPRREGIATTS